MDPSTHISTHVDTCGRSFLSLVEALTNASHFADQVRPEIVNDEFNRFKIWAGNIAAHRKGRRSLEYRLRDAAHLKTETHKLLAALQESLENALAIVNGEKTPWDELSDSDTDSESDAAGGVNGRDLQGDTELKQLMASMKNTTTCLFRLSMAIRDPAPNSQSRSTITVDKSFYEEHDILHVKAKFPIGFSFLTERLGRAISGRRQYLNYREQHHQKLAKNIEKIGYEEPRTDHTTNSTEASPMPKMANAPNDVLDDDEDALSQTSYATSVNTTIRVPPLPKEAREKEHFECPLCFLIVSIHTTTAWKQHVYHDLHPYSCTFEHCTTADRLYDSRYAWFKHELGAHRTSWQCIEGCEKTFRVEEGFAAHVQAHHSELGTADNFSALKRTSVKSASLSERAKCPLCNKQMTLRVLQKHLGHHQEQLALFALPPNLDATEDDPRDEAQSPVDVSKWQDEELSDISDSAEFDELPSSDEDLPKEMPKGKKTGGLDYESTLHEYPYQCKVSECFSAEIGFENSKDLEKHMQFFHPEMSDPASVYLVPFSRDLNTKEFNPEKPASAGLPQDNGDEDVQHEYDELGKGKARAEAMEAEPKKKGDGDTTSKEDRMLKKLGKLLVSKQEDGAGRVGDTRQKAEEAELARIENIIAQEGSALEKLKKLLLGKQESEGKKVEDAIQNAEEAKFAHLENLLIAQHEARMEKERAKRAAAEEAATLSAEAKKKRDEDRLAKLEKLILAQKDEQLNREAAVEAAHQAENADADAKVVKEVAKKLAQAEAAAKLLEAAKKEREEVEAKAAKEAETNAAAYEKALDEAGATVEELEMAKKAAEDEAAKLKPSDAPKPPIKFEDAVGRNFTFPWHLCKTWKGMEELIKQVFLYADVIGPHVREGHYDLIGPDGEIILPQVWETMVQPDMAITMHMWPMPKPSPPPPPPQIIPVPPSHASWRKERDA